MFYKFLNSIIKYGKIRIIEQDGKSSVIGSKEPYCSIKLHKNNLKRKIFINPELYIGEAFVNGDLTIEEGTLENFMDIITYNASNISKFWCNSHHISKKVFPRAVAEIPM